MNRSSAAALVHKLVRGLICLLVGLAIPIVIYDAARMWSDFVVYHHTGRALLEAGGPLYGPNSGLGWPQYFRYPPLFILLFLPLAILPLPVAAGLWAALKFVVLYFLVRSLARRLKFPSSGYWWLIPLASAPFLIQEFRNGNVQFLVFALVASALLMLQERPRLAAVALGFAVILKVWPLFFVPYLAARRQFRIVAMTLGVVVLLALIPAVYFGWSGNADLLHQWTEQEWGTGSLSNAIWYPSQSLGGILNTYLNKTDRSKWPDPNYPDLQLFSVDPAVIRMIWITLVGFAYSALLWIARRKSDSPGWLTDALAFAALPLLQPFAHRIVFVVLLWPLMVVAAMLSREGLTGRSKYVLYVAVTIFVIEPFLPGSKLHRLLEIGGLDFLATSLLAAGLLIACVDTVRNFRSEAPLR